MLKEVGFNSYPNARDREDSYTELKKIHRQKDKLRITEEAAQYIFAKLKPFN